MASKPVITREIPPLPTRAEDAHKGSVGRILIIGGCDAGETMAGAPALTARAAFRSGAGLVRIVVPESLRHVLAVMAPTSTVSPLPPGVACDQLLGIVDTFAADVVALGPGLSDSIRHGVVLELVQGCPKPLVIDADGLNQLARATAGKPGIPLGDARPGGGTGSARPCVLTPHPGEARRLLEAWGRSDGGDRQAAALALHECCGAVIVLKGHGTIVTNGERLYLNETGNAGMATGGTGDVLTGVIAALMGQGMEPFEASVLGVHLHGLAGDFAAQDIGPISMTAEDVIAYLPDAFAEFEE